jgi:hypothetical protein
LNVLNGLSTSLAVERLELSETIERDFTVARCLVPVAYLIENRGASLLLKKRASGFFKFPKNDLNDLNGWNVWNGHRF